VDEAEKEYVRVRALQELRLNDERIFDRLSDPKHQPAQDGEAPKEMMEQFEKLRDRVKFLKERRLGLQESLRQWLEDGDKAKVLQFLDIGKEPV